MRFLDEPSIESGSVNFLRGGLGPAAAMRVAFTVSAVISIEGDLPLREELMSEVLRRLLKEEVPAAPVVAEDIPAERWLATGVWSEAV